MRDPFNRTIGFGISARVVARVRFAGQILQSVEAFLEKQIKKHKLFDKMPFLWVHGECRYTNETSLHVQYMRIGQQYGDLPIALTLDARILEWADRNNLDLLHDIFMIAALEALIQVGKKYQFPTTVLEDERSKYGDIPNTIEECQNYNRKSA